MISNALTNVNKWNVECPKLYDFITAASCVLSPLRAVWVSHGILQGNEQLKRAHGCFNIVTAVTHTGGSDPLHSDASLKSAPFQLQPRFHHHRNINIHIWVNQHRDQKPEQNARHSGQKQIESIFISDTLLIKYVWLHRHWQKSQSIDVSENKQVLFYFFINMLL